MVRISLVPVLTPLYLYVSTFRSMCAVPNMAVSCSSLTSWFPGMLHTYFLNDFGMVTVALIITGITLLLLLLFLTLAFLLRKHIRKQSLSLISSNSSSIVIIAGPCRGSGC